MNFLGQNILLIPVFLLALALRLYNLGSESIWYDEAISYGVSGLGFLDQIRWIIEQSDNNPPFYYEVLKVSAALFGKSEFALRLPSALLGSFSVILLYLLGKRLYNRNAGLIASLILALSLFHIYYSQEARSYSLMTFLALCSYYFFLKAADSGGRKYAVLYILSSVLLAYTHYFGLFIIAAQNVFVLIQYLRRRMPAELSFRKWAACQLIILALFSPWIVVMLRHFSGINKGFWIPVPTAASVLDIFSFYSGSSYLKYIFILFALIAVLNPVRLLGSRSIGKFLSGTADGAGGFLRTESDRTLLLVIWLLVPLVIPLIVSLISSPILVHRYTIAASAAFYLLAARGMNMISVRYAGFAAAIVILALSYRPLTSYYPYVYKDQWREAVAYIDQNSSDGDYVILNSSIGLDPVLYYLDSGKYRLGVLSGEFFTNVNAGDKKVWLLRLQTKDDKEELERVFLYQYRKRGYETFRGIDVYSYEKRR